MSNVQQYQDYATAFDAAYSSNDWISLEQFFTDNAEYNVIGSTFYE